MSVNAGAPAAAAADDGPPSKEKLSRILKAFNVINALFLAVTGVVSFILITPDFSQVLCACYVIFFSLMLLCFECHLGCLDAVIYRNFGFMFNWGGRLVFLFLNGVLAFTLGVMGIVAGGFTGVVILVNMFILCRYRDFGEEYEREFAALRDQAAGRPARPNGGDDRAMQAVVAASAQSSAAGGGGGSAYSGSGLGGALVDAAVRNPETTIAIGTAVASNPHVQAAASQAVSDAAANRNPFLDSGSGGGVGSMTEANGWKKYLDDKSGKYYFYNEKTKETKWDTED